MEDEHKFLLIASACALFVVAVASGGCGTGGAFSDEPTNWEVQCVQAGAAAVTCMIDCAKAANPLSDEEGEDLVEECGKQCTNMLCEKRSLHFVDNHGWKDCEYASGNMARYCAQRGYKKPAAGNKEAK